MFWFDTTYYHLLYQHRDEAEAQAFLDKLIQFLQPPANSRLLDVACGKGRHAIYLAEKGLEVVGIDLAEKSIQHAKQYAHSHLRFEVQDIREPFMYGQFDYITNLFTSFGYFDSDEQHLQVLRHIKAALADRGTFVLDFMNVQKTIAHLVPHETKTVQGIDFELKRYVENNTTIVKDIWVQTNNNGRLHFQERVRAFTLADFQGLLEMAGLELEHTFGNYQLDDFEPSSSDRLILICKKGTR